MVAAVRQDAAAFLFWAGWLALIAGASTFHLVIGPTLSLPTDQGAGYQCSDNTYNCGDFRTGIEAQIAYQPAAATRTTCIVSMTMGTAWPASACR